MRDSGTERSAEDAVGALPSTRLEVVVPKITTTILGGPAMAAASGDAGDPGEAGEAALAEVAPADGVVGSGGGRLPRFDRWAYFDSVGAMVVVGAFAFGDTRVALISGALVGVHAAMRLIVPRVTFSFGQGFVGYRGDPRWPQGVQEDDDVHWNWKRPTASVPRHIPVTRALGGGNGVPRH
jgi:hypothetical protein